MNYIFNFSDDRFEQTVLLEKCINLLQSKKVVHWIDGRAHKYCINDYLLSFAIKKTLHMDYMIKIFNDLRGNYPEYFYFSTLKRTKNSMRLKHRNIGEVENFIKDEIITRTRDSDPNSIISRILSNSFRKLYDQVSFSIFETLENRIEKNDVMYFFNGRFLRERSAINFLSNNFRGCKFLYVERFSPQWNDRYFVFRTNVHSVSERTKIIENFYKYGGKIRNKKAKKWFEDRISGKGQPYTSKQTVTNCPELNLKSFDVFFHSSEDELIISNLKTQKWKNQFYFVKELIELYQTQKRSLVIRLHPNLKNKSLREKFRWRIYAKKYSNKYIQFVMPSSKINSYQLIKNSRLVLTYGSTIGVEAAYIKKPSMLFSNAFHEKLNCTVNIKSMAQFRDLILRNTYMKKNHLRFRNSLKYGFFMANGGEYIRHLEKLGSDNLQDPIYCYQGRLVTENSFIARLKFVESFVTKIFLSLIDLIHIAYKSFINNLIKKR